MPACLSIRTLSSTFSFRLLPPCFCAPLQLMQGFNLDLFVKIGPHIDGICNMCHHHPDHICPAARTDLHHKWQTPVYYQCFSGQHRVASFLEVTHQTSQQWKDNKQWPKEIKVRILQSETPQFILDWLINELNNYVALTSQNGCIIFLKRFP